MIRKMRILAYFLILNLTLISKASLQEVRVIDGDSLVIENKKYRLFGIDAPEMQQICFDKMSKVKCGVLSREVLVNQIKNKSVNCKKITTDRYKRIVADCFIEANKSLSSYMVKNGYAFAYRRYSDQFVQDEEYAKLNQLGLWKMKFDFPWDYRKKN